MRDALERFWEKVDKTGECWNWMGSTKGRSYRPYGQFWADGKRHTAHRWLYEQTHGPLPLTIDVCHSCDNSRCVRLDHLFAGTRSDNMNDCAAKGRNAMQRWPERSPFARKENRPQPRGERQGSSVLTPAQVMVMRELHKRGETTRRIGEQFGVHEGHVRKIVRGKAWAHLPL